MDNPQMALLNDKFNMFYDAAKKAYDNGNAELAKRNYMLAADALLKLAKLSSPELKKARVDRAKRLIQIAESVDVKIDNKKFEQKEQKASNNNKAKNDGNDSDEGKEWQSAEIPNIHFSDIAGLEDVKKAIITRMINPIKYPEKYEAYGKKTGGGVLLYGPPGTGKTMIAKAIACEVGAKFYAIKGSDIVSKWVGESEQNINSLFETARQDDLAIIFIDEMDSLIGRRGVDQHNDKRVNEFLQQIDGFVGRNPNLLLLGATNRPWDIDSAAMRSGRFSQKIYVPLPDEDARRFLFNKAIKNAPVASDVNINELVSLSEGYSGADIDEVCDRAKENPLLKAIETDSIVKITRRDFIGALRTVPPSVDPKELVRFEQFRGTRYNAKPKKDIEDDIFEPIDDEPNEPIAETPSEPAYTPEPVAPAPAPKAEAVEVLFETTEVNMMLDSDVVLECYISKPFNMVSMKIDGNNYICSSKIRNWTTEPLDILPGTYKVDVMGDGKLIASEEITFSKGIQENDFDI